MYEIKDLESKEDSEGQGEWWAEAGAGRVHQPTHTDMMMQGEHVLADGDRVCCNLKGYYGL